MTRIVFLFFVFCFFLLQFQLCGLSVVLTGLVSKVKGPESKLSIYNRWNPFWSSTRVCLKDFFFRFRVFQGGYPISRSVRSEIGLCSRGLQGLQGLWFLMEEKIFIFLRSKIPLDMLLRDGVGVFLSAAK